VSFSINVDGSRVSWGRIDAKGYTASTYGSLRPEKFEPGRKVPIYAYAAAEGGLTGLTTKPLEQLAAEYPLLVVVLAELQEDEGS
jgi:hypothetical protein